MQLDHDQLRQLLALLGESDIQELRLVGPDAAGFTWALSELAGPQGDDPPQGRCLGVQGINLVQKRLQNAIMARGYVTTRVVVENQNIASGVLSLRPISGRLAQVVVPDSARGHIHAAAALPAGPGDLLNLRDVEQALENLQRVPTVQADLQIAPGQEAGLSDLQLNWTQDRRWRLGVSLDDAGSDSTGKFQGTTTASADNLLGLSDLAYISYTRALGGGEGPSPKGSQALAAHYSVPWGYWLYSLNLSRHHYHQTVEGAFDNYRYSGESDHIELNVDRVLWRNNQHVTTAHASLQRRTSNNFIDDTEVLVQRRAVASLVWGLSHRMYWGPAILAGDFTFKQGLSGLGSLPAPEDAFDEGTSRYRLTTASLKAQVPWKAQGDAWRYSATVRLQKHHTRLTPQDRFSIGGRYTVRGFDNEASLVAESGVVWRNEPVCCATWCAMKSRPLSTTTAPTRCAPSWAAGCMWACGNWTRPAGWRWSPAWASRPGFGRWRSGATGSCPPGAPERTADQGFSATPALSGEPSSPASKARLLPGITIWNWLSTKV